MDSWKKVGFYLKKGRGKFKEYCESYEEYCFGNKFEIVIK